VVLLAFAVEVYELSATHGTGLMMEFGLGTSVAESPHDTLEFLIRGDL
jgi:hypothetical protein